MIQQESSSSEERLDECWQWMYSQHQVNLCHHQTSRIQYNLMGWILWICITGLWSRTVVALVLRIFCFLGGWVSAFLALASATPFIPHCGHVAFVTVRNGELVWSVSAFAETEVVVGVCGVTYFFYRGGLREDWTQSVVFIQSTLYYLKDMKNIMRSLSEHALSISHTKVILHQWAVENLTSPRLISSSDTLRVTWGDGHRAWEFRGRFCADSNLGTWWIIKEGKGQHRPIYMIGSIIGIRSVSWRSV